MFILVSTWITGKHLMKHHCRKKNNFIANLSVENITDVDYMHAKRVCKDFEIKTLGEYHDFHLKKYILLLENLSFRSCLISFISWFSMTSSFKKG